MSGAVKMRHTGQVQLGKSTVWTPTGMATLLPLLQLISNLPYSKALSMTSHVEQCYFGSSQAYYMNSEQGLDWADCGTCSLAY